MPGIEIQKEASYEQTQKNILEILEVLSSQVTKLSQEMGTLNQDVAKITQDVQDIKNENTTKPSSPKATTEQKDEERQKISDFFSHEEDIMKNIKGKIEEIDEKITNLTGNIPILVRDILFKTEVPAVDNEKSISERAFVGRTKIVANEKGEAVRAPKKEGPLLFVLGKLCDQIDIIQQNVDIMEKRESFTSRRIIDLYQIILDLVKTIEINAWEMRFYMRAGRDGGEEIKRDNWLTIDSPYVRDNLFPPSESIRRNAEKTADEKITNMILGLETMKQASEMMDSDIDQFQHFPFSAVRDRIPQWIAKGETGEFGIQHDFKGYKWTKEKAEKDRLFIERRIIEGFRETKEGVANGTIKPRNEAEMKREYDFYKMLGEKTLPGHEKKNTRDYEMEDFIKSVLKK